MLRGKMFIQEIYLGANPTMRKTFICLGYDWLISNEWLFIPARKYPTFVTVQTIPESTIKAKKIASTGLVDKGLPEKLKLQDMQRRKRGKNVQNTLTAMLLEPNFHEIVKLPLEFSSMLDIIAFRRMRDNKLLYNLITSNYSKCPYLR